MTCAVLSIGTELTRGELVNSSAAWLASELTAIGFEVLEHHVVVDHGVLGDLEADRRELGGKPGCIRIDELSSRQLSPDRQHHARHGDTGA